jgi:hypothetical protein
MSRRVLAGASLMVLLSACSIAAAPEADSSRGAPIARAPGAADAPDQNASPGATADGSLLDLGDAAAGAAVSFVVPRGTLGFSIVVTAAAGQTDSIGVQELTNPSGTAVVRDFADVAAQHRPTSGTNGTGIGIVNIPRVDDHATQAVPSGTWTARFGGITGATKGATGTAWSGNVHVAVRLQTSADGAFHGGALDLDLYVPEGLVVEGSSGSHAITAATAPNDAGLQSRLATTFGLFHRLYGLDRGEVRYHALPASLTSISSQSGVDAANVLATATSARPAAQVILTNHLSPDGDGSEISGVSNCLPGAVGVPGTTCSAVIVALRSGSPAWLDATTIVHELGHFAGLEHSTEFGGEADSLTDTPACTDMSKSGLATCPDHDNLMFPSVNLADAVEAVAVSPTQAAIVRSSPLYRATR